MFLPLKDKQFEFWRLKRRGLPDISMCARSIYPSRLSQNYHIHICKHGMQVWYEHEGDCWACNRYTQCTELLWDFAEEMKLKLEKTVTQRSWLRNFSRN